MKKYLFFFLFFSLLIISCINDDDDDMNLNSAGLFSTEARVVGYLARYEKKDEINFCKITHLNIAFVNQLPDGTIKLNNRQYDLSEIINTALSQNNNIKIFIALGGGWLSEEMAITWKFFLANPNERKTLIDKIVSFVLEHNLDGVDVDLEWSRVTSGYSDFIIELKDALKIHSKGISAALPSETKYDNLNSNALNALDFINIMSYDFTGPWNPSKPGQHSSFYHAQRGINFWKNTIGIPGEKLTLGVPFYGYDFKNSTTVESFKYGSIVASNKSNADRDNIDNKFYNGRPTIRKKVDLAAKNISGIMIWELGSDSFSEYSLLETIHKTYTDLGVKTTELCGN